MAELQFQRRCRVTIVATKPNSKDTIQASSLVIEDLRVKFQLKKSWLWTPNIGSIEITNLAEDSRKRLQVKNARVLLEAGYGDKLVQVGILSGKQINHKHEGADWTTKIEGGDGGKQFFHGRVNLSVGKNHPVLDFATKLIDRAAAKVDRRFSLTKLQQATAGRVFKHGRTARGNASEELRYLLRELGLEHSVQDETLYIHDRKDKAINEILRISSDSGLVGSPEYGSPPHPGKPRMLKFKMLLAPTVRVGSKLNLDSKAHKGDYIVRVVTHAGDTHGNDWYTTVECLGVKGAT